MKKYLSFICSLFMLISVVPILAQVKPPIILPENLQVITPENGSKIVSLTTVDRDTKQISVSPDSMLVAVATQHGDLDYSISIVDMNTKAVVSHMQGRMDSFRELVWSPDSKQIAVSSARTTGSGVEERSVKTYTIETGTNLHYYILGKSDTWYSEDVNAPKDGAIIYPVEIAWNPGSDLIAITFYDKLEVYDVNADNKLFSEQVNGIQSVDWSSDGKFITTQNGDGRLNVWGIQSSN